jgi:hypothetical protein
MNVLTQAMDYILALAEERQLAYPLHIAITSPDGGRIELLIRAKGRKPTVLEEHLGPDGPGLPLPSMATVSEWDNTYKQPKPRHVHYQIALGDEDGKPALIVESAQTGTPTQALIADLEREAAKLSHRLSHAVLVLASPIMPSAPGPKADMGFVTSYDADRVERLDDALLKGDLPVGLVIVTFDPESEAGGKVTFSLRFESKVYRYDGVMSDQAKRVILEEATASIGRQWFAQTGAKTD